jgi:hypothetical protein
MSHKGPFIIFRLIGFLLVIGLIVGGGTMVYRAGIAQGISQAPAVAAAISKATENGQVAPVPPMIGRGYGDAYGYGPGYYPMMGHHFFGFFPFGAICGSVFFLFFFFGLMKMIFFRRMWGGYGYHRHGPPWMQHQDHDKKEKEGGEQKEDENKKE